MDCNSQPSIQHFVACKDRPESCDSYGWMLVSTGGEWFPKLLEGRCVLQTTIQILDMTTHHLDSALGGGQEGKESAVGLKAIQTVQDLVPRTWSTQQQQLLLD